jgi:hypothetical protein
MTPRSEKDYRGSSNTSFILSAAWMASTCARRGRGLPSFLPLAQTGLLDSNRLLVHLWQRKASLSRLTWGLFHKEGLTWVWLAESGCYNLYEKLLWLILIHKLFSSERDIEPPTKSTMAVHGRSMNQSLDLGMITNHMLPESTGQSPELLESTEHSSKPITPNPYSLY